MVAAEADATLFMHVDAERCTREARFSLILSRNVFPLYVFTPGAEASDDNDDTD